MSNETIITIRPLAEPLISVIIPVFNRAHWVTEAIASVEHQTIATSVETIVVDYGSTDETANVVSRLQAGLGGLTLVRQSNTGVSAARNTGLRLARGRFIQFLDSDDCLVERKLETQWRRLDANHGADFVTSGWQRCNFETGEVLEERGTDPLIASWAILPDFLIWNFWITGAALYRREICERTGPWDPHLSFCEDWEWHIRMGLVGGTGVHLPEVLLHVREHANTRLSEVTLPADKVTVFNRFLDKVVQDFAEHPKVAVRYANLLAALLFRASSWSCRADCLAEANRLAQVGIQHTSPAWRRSVCRIILTLVKTIGWKHTQRLYDAVHRGVQKIHH